MRIIAGTARSRIIEAPAGRDTRPTLDRVRENLFNMLQTRIRGTVVLDLFAGSGALALEALSRGASFAVLGDRDREASRIERKNIEALGFGDRTCVLQCDWQRTVETVRSEGRLFDLIFLDPPYAMRDLCPVMEALKSVSDGETLIVLEHEAKTEPIVPSCMEKVNERHWGYCGVSMYTFRGEGDGVV